MMPPRFLWLKQPRRGTSYIDVDEREDRGRMYGRMGGGRGVIQPVLRDFFLGENRRQTMADDLDRGRMSQEGNMLTQSKGNSRSPDS